MSSSQYSRKRYYPSQEGFAEWYDIIGANMAFRKTALESAGIDTEQFPSYGEEMIIAFHVAEKGWKVYYSPKAWVCHQPHGFRKQVSQIHHWGRAEVRLKRAGVQYPERDPAYFLFIPVLILFSLAYVYGEIKETLIGDNGIKSMLKRRLTGRGQSA